MDSGDGVFIGGKHLHHNFKQMTNTELTLNQLAAIAAGVRTGKDAIAGNEMNVFANNRHKVFVNNQDEKYADKIENYGGGKDNGVLVKTYC